MIATTKITTPGRRNRYGVVDGRFRLRGELTRPGRATDVESVARPAVVVRANSLACQQCVDLRSSAVESCLDRRLAKEGRCERRREHGVNLALVGARDARLRRLQLV